MMKQLLDNKVNWFYRLFTPKPKQDASPLSAGFYDALGKPVPLSLKRQDLRSARELIRKAALKAAAKHGIAAHLLNFEVVTIADEEKAYFQLQVSLRVWDGLLWAQSVAFEEVAMKAIREADPNTARAVRAVLWRVLPEADCPHDTLSGVEAWRADAMMARNTAHTDVQRPNNSSSNAASPVVQTVPEFSQLSATQAQAPAVKAEPKSQLAAFAATFANKFATTESSALPGDNGFAQTQPFSGSEFSGSEFPASSFPATRPFSLEDEVKLPPVAPKKS